MMSDTQGREPSVHALARAHQAHEASRVLQAALKAAGLPQIARLVVTDQPGPGPYAVHLSMRPDEARELAAFIDRSRLALHR
jgi:hypothetical protein